MSNFQKMILLMHNRFCLVLFLLQLELVKLHHLKQIEWNDI